MLKLGIYVNRFKVWDEHFNNAKCEEMDANNTHMAILTKAFIRWISACSSGLIEAWLIPGVFLEALNAICLEQRGHGRAPL